MPEKTSKPSLHQRTHFVMVLQILISWNILVSDIETNFVTVSETDKKELGDHFLPLLELYRKIAY